MPPKIAAAAAVAQEKRFIIQVSVSQAKHIPFNSSILRVALVSPKNPDLVKDAKMEIAGRGSDPVYNETFDFHLTAIPDCVEFTLLEPKFFGSPVIRAKLRVPLAREHFPTDADNFDGKRHRACPLSFNSFIKCQENGEPLAPVKGAAQPEVQTVGQLELEIKCGLKTNATALAYRETLGVMAAKVSKSSNLPKPASGKKLFVEVSYGLQRLTTKAGDASGSFDDMMRLWVYEKTKDYRMDFAVIERGEKEVAGGVVVARCLVSTSNFVTSALKNDNSDSTTISVWCDFQLPTAAVASDRDEGTLKARTVDVGGEVVPQSPTSKTIMGIQVEFTFTPKAVAEKLFYCGLWEQFDADKSGSLDRVEVAAMMDTLRVNMSDADIDKFVASVDADGSGQLDQEEVLRLLQSGEFQSSALSSQMMSFLLDGKEGLERMISGDDTTSSVKMVNGHAVRTTSTGEEDSDDMGLLLFDRNSGMMLHEHIPWYIKVALKSMYRSGLGRKVAQTQKVRNMLVAQSQAEGKKMNDPASKAKITGFIQQYGLDVGEILEPISSFPHFNAFFYRKLKPGVRPIDKPDDSTVVVSPADCRTSVFKKMTDATKVWIKGSEFTVEKLLGPRQDVVPLFTNPVLVISRLAPQDYHRVHFPVTGTMGKITEIGGTLMTVNPCAVRCEINVYTENMRTLLELRTKEFGTVILIMVGATMVGSINVNEQYKKEGTPFKKGDDLGYFAFGGSTTLLLFQPGSIELDQDLVDFSAKPIEVLLRQGQQIGKATGHFAESTSAATASLDNLRTFFGRFDADGSGLLDRSEAIACVSLLFPDESVAKIVDMIKNADADNDGRMSFLEFCAIAKNVERLPQARANTAGRLKRFYDKYNKEAIVRIPEILAKYEGREDELFQTLRDKYGPEP